MSIGGVVVTTAPQAYIPVGPTVYGQDTTENKDSLLSPLSPELKFGDLRSV